MNLNGNIIVAIIVLALVQPAAARQSSVAMGSGSGTLILINSASKGLIGYSFIPNHDLIMVELGVVDTFPEGLNSWHDVAIFERQSGNLVAMTTILSGDDSRLQGDDRFEPIDPVFLRRGVEYYTMSNNWHIDMARFTVPSQGSAVQVHTDLFWTGSMISRDSNSVLFPYVAEEELDPGFGANFIFGRTLIDCNNNGISDSVDIASGDALDCNGNYTPDTCEIADGTSTDCDGNGVLDSCQPDCDGDGESDPCQVVASPELDCNENFLLDSCELAGNPFLDGNGNGIIDLCEICAGDADHNGVVTVADLLDMLAVWGACGGRCLPGQIDPECPADTNLDCDINVSDLLNLLANWGACS